MSKSNKPKEEEKNIVIVEDALGRSERFIERNYKIIIGTVAAVVLIIAVFIGFTRFVIAPRETEARAEMFMAEIYFMQDSLQLALEGDAVYPGFLDIIADYRFTSSANLARYYAGIIFLRKGEFEQAIENLKRFRGRDQLVTAMSYGAIGDAYLELENMEKAAWYYRKAYLHEPNQLTTPLFLFKAGLLYEEMQKPAKALELYKRILNEFPNSAEGQNIERYIGRVSVQ
ncbi:MAG TPA: tetratricopeptide repeat protein [Bacteroidales bacterium]|nr:tetratricopeptide repeat protein [Bacteroidales bacterium]